MKTLSIDNRHMAERETYLECRVEALDRALKSACIRADNLEVDRISLKRENESQKLSLTLHIEELEKVRKERDEAYATIERMIGEQGAEVVGHG